MITAGVILAGGLARRMGGGDKPLKILARKPLLEHVIARIAPQVDTVVLNANDNPARFAEAGLPVIPDTVLGNPGPLAGILAGMEWVRAVAGGDADLLSVPGDAPFLPLDLVERLRAVRGAETADVAWAANGDRIHPVIALWPVRLAGDLRRALTEDGLRKVEDFGRRYSVACATFPEASVNPFFNVNTPADLVEAERMISQ